GRKEALETWKKAVASIREDGDEERAREKGLLLWQKAVAETLGVEGATPSWGAIALGIQTLSQPDQEELGKCWEESENGLYGRSPNLDGGWCDKAEQLAMRIDLPKLSFWAPFRLRNLVPWAVGALLLLAQVTPAVAEQKQEEGKSSKEPTKENPISLYRAGSFAEAGREWEGKLHENRGDPLIRNNLALAYFQLGDKERALAYGLSAYLISPETASEDLCARGGSAGSGRARIVGRPGCVVADEAPRSFWMAGNFGFGICRLCLGGGPGVGFGIF
ncbi:MAG: hypothetical protein EBS97_08570, partial [Verrucomicrobia bacterium]|nr:hypothetical protein [Verrucomicrobiota bacterium]